MPAADQAAQRAVRSVPGIPVDEAAGNGNPVFREPWEAQAFAITLALHEKGLFAWGEWAAMLGATITAAQAAGDPDTGATYYHHWLVTLERMVAEKSLTTAADLHACQHAWEHAAARTPHGQPIELQPRDFAPT